MSSHCNVNTIKYYYPKPPVGDWYHFVVATDENGTRIYINGEEKASNSHFVINTNVLNKDLSIGVDVSPSGIAPYVDGNVRYHDGMIDDVRIYNRALSEAEIWDLYQIDPFTNNTNLKYTPVTPCRIVDTRKTSAGMIDANTQRNFRVYGSVGGQGGNLAGCPSPGDQQPLAAHINMVAVNPTGKGNLQAFPVGAGTGAGLSVNYNTIDTNLANA